MNFNKTLFKLIFAIVSMKILLTWFYYAHETFPKPLRAASALLATPVAVASGLSYYLNLGIPVYESPWAVVLTNFIFSTVLIYVMHKLIRRKIKKNNN